MRRVNSRRFKWRSWPVLLLALIIIIGGGTWAARSWDNRNLAAVSSSTEVVYFPIETGSSLQEIAQDLAHVHLIRSATAFETYVRGRQLYAKMQAGTYALSPSMSTPQIVDKIVKGEVSKNYVTILPGKTIKQIKRPSCRQAIRILSWTRLSTRGLMPAIHY
jgi:UPF0755 protein